MVLPPLTDNNLCQYYIDADSVGVLYSFPLDQGLDQKHHRSILVDNRFIQARTIIPG